MRSRETINPNQARKHLEAASNLQWFHWVIVLGSLVLTFFAWSYSTQQKNKRVEAQFERESDQVIELVRERMSKYEDALWNGVALIQTFGGDIDSDDWTKYAENIHLQEKYPGINGIGVIHDVSKAEYTTYLAKQRKLRPGYHVHPPHNNSQHLPISYVIPVAGNEKAVGLDIAHETNRFTAAIKSRDSGQANISGPITLVQDSGKTPGFLFYTPFYSDDKKDTQEDRLENFSGLVYAPFVVNKLMDGVLEKGRRNVGIRISDGTDVLYDEHHVSEEDFDPAPLFARTLRVNLYGRDWQFDIWSAKSFRDALTDHQPLTILVGGLAIDSLLVLLIISISRSSKKSLRYADLMTRQLEDNTATLQSKKAQLETSNKTLSRFNKAAAGRELRMLELKREVNELLQDLGDPIRYPISEENHQTSSSSGLTALLDAVQRPHREAANVE